LGAGRSPQPIGFPITTKPGSAGRRIRSAPPELIHYLQAKSGRREKILAKNFPLGRARKLLEQKQTNSNAHVLSVQPTPPQQAEVDPHLHARVSQLLAAADEAHRRNDVAAVRRILKHITSLAPDNTELWLVCGVTLRKQGYEEEALTYYDHLLTLNPNHAIGWRSKGVALANLDRLDEAKSCYEKALSLDPSNHEIWNSIAVLHVRSGDPHSAKPCYEKALELNPTSTWAMRNLMICHLRLDDTDAAIATARRILAIDPNYAEALAFLQQLDE
jgi:tetratricopeptide (TPR) repeat protein